MAENSAISWTTHTFSGWWGCTKVGPGCDHCYAETFDRRVGGSHWGSGSPRRLIKDWSGPRKWHRQAEKTGERPWVFASSMCDVFDNEVPTEWRDRLWALVRETPLLRWQFITKRIGNAAKMLPSDWPDAFGHCGLMSTIVNQAEADRDIVKLLAIPAAWRGLSMEPLLGPVDLTRVEAKADGRLIDGSFTYPKRIDALTGISGHYPSPTIFYPDSHRLGRLDWIIAGGESGPGARPMSIQWARSLRDQCASAGVPFHFKQWGEWAPSRSVPSGTSGKFAFGDYEFDPTAFHVVDHYPREFDKLGSRCTLERVGKDRAGRRLDGIEHNGMPHVGAL